MTDANQPAAPPECAVFQKDVGTWDVTLEMRPGPGAPQVSRGVATGRLISGGRWLVVDFKNETTGFEGHGVYGWDVAKGKYVGSWVDDMRPFLAIAEGDWDAAKQTMTWWTECPGPNGTMRFRETMQTIGAGQLEFKVFVPTPDGGELEMMTAAYHQRG